MKMARKPTHGDGWYGAAQAARLAGLSTAMVNYLCRSHLVEPSCSCRRGHGSKRHYSFGDVVALRLVGGLSKTGVRPTRIRAALQRLKRHHPEITLTSLPAKYVVTDGVDLYLRNARGAVERLRDGQMAFAFVIELERLRAEVVAALAA